MFPRLLRAFSTHAAATKPSTSTVAVTGSSGCIGSSFVVSELDRRFLRAFSTAASTASKQSTVAVTGSSGYIGSFVVSELLDRGYKVHCPIRGSTENPGKAEHLLKHPNAANLTIFDGGDLSKKGSFDEAFASADAVIHTAAQVDLGEDESIITDSVEGTKNVLSSVDKSPGVKRFVQTSSVAAIQKYNVPPGYVFTERDWNDWSTVANGDAYGVAKTTAEKLVHSHFASSDGRSAAAVNPGVVIGPVMNRSHTKASAYFLYACIMGKKAMNFPATFVDVRDVAAGHVNALESLPSIHGGRFLLVNDDGCVESGPLGLGEIASEKFPEYRFDIKPLYPEHIMKFARPLSMLPIVGHKIMNEYQRLAQSTPVQFDNKTTKEKLGLEFRPLDVTVKEGIESIIEKGFAEFKK
jgi:nucleoside-diphosphate-sugar epimerase